MINFYYQTDFISTAPHLKDEITVWAEKGNEKGKEKIRKY